MTIRSTATNALETAFIGLPLVILIVSPYHHRRHHRRYRRHHHHHQLFLLQAWHQNILNDLCLHRHCAMLWEHAHARVRGVNDGSKTLTSPVIYIAMRSNFTTSTRGSCGQDQFLPASVSPDGSPGAGRGCVGPTNSPGCRRHAIFRRPRERTVGVVYSSLYAWPGCSVQAWCLFRQSPGALTGWPAPCTSGSSGRTVYPWRLVWVGRQSVGRLLACKHLRALFQSEVYVSPEWSQDAATEPIVQDEHNRLGADGDVCLPFDLERPGYSEPCRKKSVSTLPVLSRLAAAKERFKMYVSCELLASLSMPRKIFKRVRESSTRAVASIPS